MKKSERKESSGKIILIIVIVLIIGAVLLLASRNETEGDAILSMGDTVSDFKVASIEIYDPSDMVYHEEDDEFYARTIKLDEIREPFFEGRIEFTGSTTVSGDYRYDEIFGQHCFFVDEATSDSIPRIGEDSRVPWFCFWNDDDVEEDVAENGLTDRTIVISDYHYVLVGTTKSDRTNFVEAVK